jgi:hypothetical protein
VTVPYAPGLQYDAGSMVPDFAPIGGIARNIVNDVLTQKMLKQLGQNSDAAGAADATPEQKTKLQADNDKILQRMARIDPQAAKFHIGLMGLRDAQTHEVAAKEAENASRVYQSILDAKDPTERNKVIADTIREQDAKGVNTDKLREMIGKKPDEQTLFARRQVILAGDSKMLHDNSLADIEQALKVQGEGLKNLQTQQQMQLAAAEERRKATEVNTKATDKAAAVETANTAARDTASTVNTQIDDVLATLDNASTGLTGSVAARANPQGTTAEKYRKLETLKSMIAIDKMIEMKKNSPTGSTGFGALSEKELAVLQNAIGNLDPSQSNEVLTRELGKVRDFFSGISQRAGGAKLAARQNADPTAQTGKIGRFQVTVHGMSP